jgi:hypothetical protein
MCALLHNPQFAQASMTLITLTTDFGLADSYVAAMKGVILGIAPRASLVDITHQIDPQNVRQAAVVLQAAIAYFPPGTIHVAVVDPGVGSARRAIALRAEHSFFVGPDNGLFSVVLADAAPGSVRVVHLDQPAYWRPAVSRTFHGRDIFAPVAAHLAAGAPFEALGTPIADPVVLDFSHPSRLADGSVLGEVSHVDRFGNLISTIPETWLAGRAWVARCAGQEIAGPSTSYASAQSGELLMLIGSSGTLEIAVREGSAAERLRAGVGEFIQVRPLP